MKERPILFSGAMVRALLAGTKTQTRRAVKGTALEWLLPGGFTPEFTADPANELCPYGAPGDRLWVKEAHSIGPGPDVHLEPGETAGALRWPHVTYAADGAVERRDEPWRGVFGKSRSPIHMPRWASRITLEITSVRVERLQDISEPDAKAEGAVPADPCDHTRLSCEEIGCSGPEDYRGGYRALWESINGAGSWDANPWVWVVEFRRVTP